MAKTSIEPSKIEVCFDRENWQRLDDRYIVFAVGDGRLVYQRDGSIGSVPEDRWRFVQSASQDAITDFLDYLDGRIEWFKGNLDDIDCAIRHDEACYLRDRLDTMLIEATNLRNDKFRSGVCGA